MSTPPSVPGNRGPARRPRPVSHPVPPGYLPAPAPGVPTPIPPLPPSPTNGTRHVAPPEAASSHSTDPHPRIVPTDDGADGWWNLFESAAEPTPAQMPSRFRRTFVIAGVAVAVAVLGAIGTGFVVRSTTTDTPTASKPAEVKHRIPDPRLLGMLPAGISANSCKPGDETGPQPSVVCGGSSMASDPIGVTLIGAPDPSGLDAELKQVLSRSKVVLCPGNIQSPGPWRRYPTQPPAGTLMCGLQEKNSVLAWTDEARLLTVVAVGEPGAEALPLLYRWWTLHA